MANRELSPKNPNIDGGWAWWIVAATLLSNALIGGFDRSVGIIYEELLMTFDSTAAMTAALTSMLFGLKFMLGPISGSLAKYLTARVVVFLGALCTFFGLLLSSFSRNLPFLYFSFGILLGLGNGLCYTPCIVSVTAYFSRRLATALGLSYAGTGLGSFLMPLLVTLLVEQFTCSGALLVLAAVQLHLAVSAALLRPLATNKEFGEDEDFPMMDDMEQQPFRAPQKPKLPRKRRCSGSCARGFLADILRSFDFALFKSRRFLLPSIAAMLITSGFKSVPLLLSHHASLCGLSREQASLLLSFSGISDTASRILTGLAFDLEAVRPWRRLLWNGTLLLLAGVVVLIGICKTFWALALLSCLFGASSGVFVCQLIAVLVELVGKKRSSAAIGLLHLLRGIGALFGPAFAGHLKDHNEGYSASFAFLGSSIAIGALLFAPTLCLRRPDEEEL